MADCANCSNAAAYAYEPVQGNQTLFCATHLPSFAKKPQFSGAVVELAAQPKVEEVIEEAPVEEAPKPKPGKKASVEAEPVVEEAPVEEAPVEEAPAEEAK